MCEVGGHEEDIPSKLEIIFTAPRHGGPTQRHLLNEDGKPVAGGREIQLKVTFK